MSADKLKVDTVKLKADIKDINASIITLENVIKEFEQAYYQLHTMWEGPASEVFLEVYNEDVLDLKELIKALKEFNLFESDAENKYTRCAIEVDDIIRSI